MLLVESQRAVLPGGVLVEDGPVYVLVDDARIVSVSRESPAVGEEVEVKRANLVTPGFVDIHTHGIGEREREREGVSFAFRPNTCSSTFSPQEVLLMCLTTGQTQVN